MAATLLETILGLGPASWRDRLQEQILLISPVTKQPFSALWQGSSRSTAKKLGIFTYPGINGSFVQDLNTEADRYPMTIFFEGNSHDLDAGRFFFATKEKGEWLMLHPIHGPLQLNLVSVEMVDDPTNSGNITAVNLDWIESIDPSSTFSLSQIGAVIQTLGSAINGIASLLFSQSVNQNNATFIQAIRNISNVAVVAVTRNLSIIFEQDPDIEAEVISIQRAIPDTLEQDVIDVELLGGQFQQMIQISMEATDDLLTRLDALDALVDQLILTTPTEPTIIALNSAATLELILVANIIAASQVITTSTLFSRKESLNALELYVSIFNKIVNALDNIQTLFLNNIIENQYFSMLDSFTETARMVAQTANFLLTQSFDLAIERKFILTRPRNPLEITVTEYGTLEENDSNLDLFIDTNNLKGNDIILLPAGRDVVVYA